MSKYDPNALINDIVALNTLDDVIKTLTDDSFNTQFKECGCNDDFMEGYYFAVDCLCGMKDSIAKDVDWDAVRDFEGINITC